MQAIIIKAYDPYCRVTAIGDLVAHYNCLGRRTGGRDLARYAQGGR